MPLSLPSFLQRKKDPVRLVLQGYGLKTGGTKDECLARLAYHMQQNPDAHLDDTSPELELVAQYLRSWYSKGTGLSVNSTWFLGGERLRPWQQGTEIHHAEAQRKSVRHPSGKTAPPPLAVQTDGLTAADRTLSIDSLPELGDEFDAEGEPPRIGLPSPRGLRSPRLRTPKTPRTPGGSIVKLLLFRDV